MTTISDAFSELNFYEYHQIFLDNNYYSLLFPFLLSYALFFTVLSQVKLFKNKSTGKSMTSIVSIISLIVSWYGVNFETSSGWSVGDLLMVMFPNISTLTIMILGFYVVGSILGFNFFDGLFRKDHSAYLFIAIGAIGLGAVIFYTGIAMGFWDYSVYDLEGYWSVIIAIGLLILGIVFIVIDMVPIGILLLMIFGTFVYNSGDGNILSYFVDPVIFIGFIFVVLFGWINSGNDKKFKLAKDINDREKSDLFKANLKEGESRVNDISDQTYQSNVKEWKKNYGDESWNRYK